MMPSRPSRRAWLFSLLRGHIINPQATNSRAGCLLSSAVVLRLVQTCTQGSAGLCTGKEHGAAAAVAHGVPGLQPQAARSKRRSAC